MFDDDVVLVVINILRLFNKLFFNNTKHWTNLKNIIFLM